MLMLIIRKMGENYSYVYFMYILFFNKNVNYWNYYLYLFFEFVNVVLLVVICDVKNKIWILLVWWVVYYKILS